LTISKFNITVVFLFTVVLCCLPAFAFSGYAWEGDGSEHVVYLSDDGHIHELWYAGSGWNHVDLTQATGAPLAYSYPSGYSWENDGSEHVIYLGDGGSIHELWYAGSGWNHVDLTQAAGAPSAMG
jgi:hypothetical protein